MRYMSILAVALMAVVIPAAPASALPGSSPTPVPSIPNIHHMRQPLPAPVPDAPWVFLSLLGQVPGLRVTDENKVVHAGELICAWLRSGRTRASAEDELLKEVPSLNRDQAAAVVNAACSTYCVERAPQTVS